MAMIRCLHFIQNVNEFQAVLDNVVDNFMSIFKNTNVCSPKVLLDTLCPLSETFHKTFFLILY